MSFETLPAELYDAIFYQVPPAALQETVLATTRAIPSAPIPVHHLFRCIRLRDPKQAILLYRRLRKHNAAAVEEREHTAGWVNEFSLETWSVDAEIVINLVRLLPNLQALTIWVGPSSFAPEQLEELFSKPLLGLRYLALRFRPYVLKATYYQFLKGAYFDSTLVALSLWPSGILPTLSIVQDPFDQQEVQKQTFAQPIVFFRLDLSVLLRSPAFSVSLTSLRLRIPFRPVARSLCASPAALGTGNPSSNFPLPTLEFLDLSTCGVSEGEVDAIMVQFPSLQHLVLDGCHIMRGDLHEWNALGRRCALVGVRRAKEREKILKAWLESRTIVETIGSDAAPAVGRDRNSGQKVKRGRKGLATATISFRDPGPVNPPLLFRPLLSNQGSNSKKDYSKIRILPPICRLVSLSITLPSTHTPDKYPIIRAEFEEGWAEGVAVLAITRSRLRTSAGNGVRVMRFTKGDEEAEFDEGLDGLEDVDPLDPDAFEMSKEEGGSLNHNPPVLCFAGPASAGPHEDKCGHLVGWVVMGDEM